MSTSAVASAGRCGQPVVDLRWVRVVEGGDTGIDSMTDAQGSLVVYADGDRILITGVSDFSRVEVYTLSGLLVQQHAITEGQYELSLPRDTYIIRIIASHRVSTHKVMNR